MKTNNKLNNKYIQSVLARVLVISSVVVVSGCSSRPATASTLDNSIAGEGATGIFKREAETDALIYAGVATATGDVEAISGILDAHGLTYRAVSSEELNAMSVEDISKYGMIVWPGGYAGEMSGSLDQDTRDRIRTAVTQNGVSYVGICAGAFIAVSPDTTWGLALNESPLLPYYHLEDAGVDKDMVPLSIASRSQSNPARVRQISRNVMWWGGPTLQEIPQGVVARYSDTGQPAITQNWSGKGFIVLSGPHPEAPEQWLQLLGLSGPDELQHDVAWTLFQAARNRQPLPTLEKNQVYAEN